MTTAFDPDVHCPEKGTLVKWKGASVSKVMFYSETGAILRVNFFNDAADFDVVNDKYLGFMGYPKQKCAIDFVNGFFDGRLSWKVYDYGPYYTSQYEYKRTDGRHTSAMLQFFRHTVGEDDLPGSAKKDQLYLILEGIDQIDFGTKDMISCLEGVQAGTMAFESDEQANFDWTPCAAWDKDLGW